MRTLSERGTGLLVTTSFLIKYLRSLAILRIFNSISRASQWLASIRRLERKFLSMGIRTLIRLWLGLGAKFRCKIVKSRERRLRKVFLSIHIKKSMSRQIGILGCIRCLYLLLTWLNQVQLILINLSVRTTLPKHQQLRTKRSFLAL